MTTMPIHLPAVRTLLLACSLAVCATASPAAPDERGMRPDRPGHPEQTRPGPRPGGPERHIERRDPREGWRAESRRDDRWFDGAYGHNHRYPPPGRVVVLPPRPPPAVWWGGVSYRFWDGIWATPGARGWVTVRPPIGIVVDLLPDWRTAIVIGGLSYWYVNGVYYRKYSGGGYEVVAPPVAPADAAPPERSFVYPRQGQSAEQQASDEYECHRWAATQSGFDPSGVATGQTQTVSTTGRSDYQRARTACLEGRGYTVR